MPEEYGRGWKMEKSMIHRRVQCRKPEKDFLVEE
jgi:hypothetical protein